MRNLAAPPKVGPREGGQRPNLANGARLAPANAPPPPSNAGEGPAEGTSDEAAACPA